MTFLGLMGDRNNILTDCITKGIWNQYCKKYSNLSSWSANILYTRCENTRDGPLSILLESSAIETESLGTKCMLSDLRNQRILMQKISCMRITLKYQRVNESLMNRLSSLLATIMRESRKPFFSLLKIWPWWSFKANCVQNSGII